MSHSEKDIFQQLISDTQFIRWAKGRDCVNKKHWDAWETDRPEHAVEFEDAVKFVQNLSFSSSKISDTEIRYLWNKTSGMMGQGARIRRFFVGLNRIAAILFVPLLVYTAWTIVEKNRLAQDTTTGTACGNEVTVSAPVGSRSFVTLPDGSVAWLNSGTKLTYPAVFSGNKRKVRLEGEAYFKIEKSEIPFVVQNLGPAIKVYGTEFNVNSYADENFVTVALVEGKVALQVNDEEHFLNPGQVSYFNRTRKAVSIKNNEAIDHLICWKEGKYIFKDTPLSSILRILQRRYDIEIELSGNELGDYKYNATFHDEGLNQILELLQLSAPINYTYVKRNFAADATETKDKVLISKDKNRIVKH
ncbi:MAG: DUF4974 domain-containing protein [Prolixibacteraceae bacterium]|jgi:ferric-dicitrate binding protein FerR (iron transport regulator)|nr:DUF4974 domain-containing protein [Prolixibacteraceae bacterium]